ncbi:hypothetical protein F4804DRAFT_81473 [Jackrogersella minutella]|nr:hypothetical protein F4804DRAFT_81473 [Jackrogersella minutella]
MANFLVYVRNYHWSHQNTLVQSPVLVLNAPVSSLIIQPLEGINKQEPRVLSGVSDLRDDIHDHVYQAEAHGVFVSTDALRSTGDFPVWVPVHSYRYKENEVYIVNLTSFEASNVPISQICWVPGFEAPDGSLYTIIGAPRRTSWELRALALAQHLGNPGAAKLVLLDPAKLASYERIDDGRKKSIFEIQLNAIRTKCSPPSRLLSGGYRVFSSPDRHGQGRLPLEEVLMEDLEVPRYSHSDCSSQGSFDSSSDDDSMYINLTYPSLVKVPNRPYDCGCKYPGLRPTFTNPLPSHRHGTDEECAFGSAHPKHCIFADHAPKDCVIPGSREQHVHCVNLSEAIESEFEKDSGKYCFIEADALMEEAQREGHDFLDYVDLEPTSVDSPYLGHLLSPSEPDPRFTTADFDTLGDVAEPYLRDPSPVAGAIPELAQNPRVDIEAYGSPEPWDMVF